MKKTVIFVYCISVTSYHVMKLLSALLLVSLITIKTKHTKKLSQLVLIGDLGDKMWAYSYLEQSKTEENVIVSVCSDAVEDYSLSSQDYTRGINPSLL